MRHIFLMLSILLVVIIQIKGQQDLPDKLLNTLENSNSTKDSITSILDYANDIMQSEPSLSKTLHTTVQRLNSKIEDLELEADIDLLEAKLVRNQGNADRAIEILLESRDKYDQVGNINKLGTTSRMIADLYSRSGNFDKAKPMFESSVDLFRDARDTINLAFTYRGLSSLARRQGDYAQSLDLGLQAMDLFKTIQHTEGIANMHNSLGILYSQMNEYDQARIHFEQTLQMALASGSKRRQASSYRNLAFVTDHDENKRIEYYRKCLRLNQELGRTSVIANDHYDLGVSYKTIGNLDSALYHYQQAEAKYQEAGVPPHNRFVTALGEIYALVDKPQTAKKYLEQGLQRAKEVGDADDVSAAYGLLSNVYSSLGDYKTAYTYKVQHKKLDDSLISVNKNQQIAEMETTYKVKEKDLEINQLEQARALQQRTMLFVLFGLVLLALLALNLWMTSRNRKRTNLILSQQKTEIEKKNQQNETLLKEIHHRVKNNLQVISALLTLQSKYVKDERAVEALREGQDRVQSMALIHKDLYQRENLTGINIKDYFENLVDNLMESYQIDEGDIHCIMDVDPIWLDVDTMIPMGLLVNELVSNALKHAFKDKETGEIQVFLKEQAEKLILRVADNGRGITDLDVLENKSFGHSLIKSFAKRMEADITYVTENGFGVELRIKNFTKAGSELREVKPLKASA